uniref:Uncharacterized protein n=1 Tax=Zea mays TaxID=4577 RepID=C4J568_MAIZE|nr:unknown [Zea mays]ACR36417.1 unknown [Zea mays]
MRWRREWRSPPRQNSITMHDRSVPASKSANMVGRNGWSSRRRTRFSAAARASFPFLASARRSTTFMAYSHADPSGAWLWLSRRHR